jgi:hypothetical protein
MLACSGSTVMGSIASRPNCTGRWTWSSPPTVPCSLSDWSFLVLHRQRIVTGVVGWIDPIFQATASAACSRADAGGVLGTDVKPNHPTDLAITAGAKDFS